MIEEVKQRLAGRLKELEGNLGQQTLEGKVVETMLYFIDRAEMEARISAFEDIAALIINVGKEGSVWKSPEDFYRVSATLNNEAHRLRKILDGKE